MPTKTLVASAYAAHMARRAADFGVVLQGTVGVDMKAVHARSLKITMDARNGNENWLKGMQNCELIFGHARFEGPKTVRVNGELLSAERIFVNVGGRALVPDFPGVDSVPYWTNSSILASDALPEHLVVIGGSYIGLEFAQIYRRFGAAVTVVERGPRLAGKEDPEVSQTIEEFFEAEGITIRTHATCIQLARNPDGKITVGVVCEKGGPDVVGTHVLLAVGRVPNTEDLGLDQAGVETDHRGFIKVDDFLETNVPGVFALGDCNGRGAFTHTAYNDFEIAADNLLGTAGSTPRRVSDRILCYAMYTDPPLGRVGMTETEARATGRKLKVSTRPMARVGRAKEKAETWGFMKMVADAETDAILGAAILGTSGDEAIQSVLNVMANGGTATKMARTVHIHPTVAELLPTIAGDLKPVL
ncbi:mercuric reductase [Hyaloraphidium curvatum]|nr:mercuric reductase [Hyaloraphidium curvatum]